MSFEVKVTIPSGFSRSDEVIASSLKNGIQRSISLLNNAAISNAPRKTSTLMRSIYPQIDPGLGKFTGKVIQDPEVAAYGKFVEFGTGVHHEPSPNTAWTITPKNKKALFWKDANHPVRSVTIQGMQARSYMRKAFKENKDKVKEIIQDEINKGIGTIGGS